MVRYKSLFKLFSWLMAIVAVAACNNNKPMLPQLPQSPAEAPISQLAWDYAQLTHTIRNAKVIAHVKSGMFCGRATCASVSIVEINKKDTIRVLELSSMHGYFAIGEEVDVKPAAKPLSAVSFPVVAAYDHKNYKTYYGAIMALN